MKRSSVFVLVMWLVLVSCSGDNIWTMEEIAGTYALAAKKKPFIQELFSSDATSGWNYDDAYIPNIVLRPDSSFEIQGNGGSFEMVYYNGLWWISSDTIILQPWYEYYGTYDEEAISLDLTCTEVYIIKSESELEVCKSQLLDSGRTLLRR